MKKNVCLAIVLFLLFDFSSNSTAAIYTWVDANGKTHYSDQPLDKKTAREVEITPTNIMEGGKEIAENAARNRESANNGGVKPQPTTAKKNDPCQADVAMYRAFTEQQFSGNGRPKRYYLDNPNGRPITEKEQTEMIKNLGEDLKDRGCI